MNVTTAEITTTCVRSHPRTRLDRVVPFILFGVGLFGLETYLALIQLLPVVQVDVQSLPFRVAFVCVSTFCLGVLVLHKKPWRGGLHVYCTLLFLIIWSYCTLRFYGFKATVGGRSIADVVTMCVVSCGLCSLVFCFAFTEAGYKAGRSGVTLALLTCVTILAITYGGQLGEGFFRPTESLDGYYLNPLLAGYIGSNAIALALFGLIVLRPLKLSTFILHSSLVVMGFVCLLISSSRGPAIAVAISILLLTSKTLSSRRYAGRVFSITAVLALVGVYAWPYVQQTYSSLFGRLMTIQQDIEVSSAEAIRLDLWSSALREILAEPLSGHGIEVTGFEMHPHNVIIESFYTTGIIGGILFSVIALYCLTKAVRALFSPNELSWLPLLYVNSFIYGMVSGEIYLYPPFWYLLVATMALPPVRALSRPRMDRG